MSIDIDTRKNFAVAIDNCPLFATSDLKAVFGGPDGATLPLDEQGILRALEAIAFAGTSFKIVEHFSEQIVKVVTDEYSDPVFVDTRFLKFSSAPLPPREKKLPSAQTILSRLRNLVKTPYLWGGNVHKGVEKMLEFYPPTKNLSASISSIWKLIGLDCSGLLFEVTDGYTLRNSSQLIHFGQGIEIEGLTAQEIAKIAKPLDLIVWKGHVLIFLNNEEVIESRGATGVIVTNAVTRLEEIMKERAPKNSWPNDPSQKSFVLRQWYPT